MRKSATRWTPSESPSSLAENAARQALQDAGVSTSRARELSAVVGRAQEEHLGDSGGAEQAWLAVLEEEPDYIIGGLSMPRDEATLEALAEIDGLGEKRLRRYGETLLEIVRDPPPMRRRRS